MKLPTRPPWKAMIVAPLPIPILFSATFGKEASRSPVLAFLFFLVFTSLFSYAVTLFLLLPTLFIVAWITPLTARAAGLAGAALGLMLYFPVAWIMYNSTGVDSGPPTGTFLQYLERDFFDWLLWLFLAAGSITAMLFWFLARGDLAESRAANQP